MAKYTKVGVVQMKKDQSGVTVRLGNSTAKNEKYVEHVEIIVRDAKGNVKARASSQEAENGLYLMVQDPRKRLDKEGNPLSDEQLSKIPDYIKSELILVTN